MTNRLTDLNSHLFAQLERLGVENLDQEGIEREVKRTKAIVDLSAQVIDNATVAIKGAELVAKHGVGNWEKMIPNMVEKPAPAAVEKKGMPDYAKGETR